MTLITRLPYAVADAAPPLDITSEEIDIYRSGLVSAWYRAADGYDPALGWADRMGVKGRLAPVTVMPSKTTGSLYNNREIIDFGTGSTSGDLSVVNVLPNAASFSVAFVGRTSPGTAAYLWGSDETDVSATSGTWLQHLADGALQLRIGGVNAVLNTGGQGNYFTPNPPMVIASWDQILRQGQLRTNRGAVVKTGGTLTAGTDNNSTTLHVGAATPSSLGRNPGDMAEIIVFPVALSAAANASLLAKVETYLGVRYGIAAL